MTYKDERMYQLRDRFGLDGYATYHLILERIEESGSTSLTLHLREWAQLLDVKPEWASKIIQQAYELGLWSVSGGDDNITIAVNIASDPKEGAPCPSESRS